MFSNNILHFILSFFCPAYVCFVEAHNVDMIVVNIACKCVKLAPVTVGAEAINVLMCDSNYVWFVVQWDHRVAPFEVWFFVDCLSYRVWRVVVFP